jgi:hypothetical protein
MTADDHTGDETLTRWLTAALAEYQSLRQESLQAQKEQQTILQYGITGVGILIGLALQLDAEILAILLLLYLVPLLGIFIISVWFTEIFRSLRAGTFISGLEAKINSVVGRSGAPALEWESWLRARPKQRMFVRDRMSFLVLCSLNLTGTVLAGYLATRAEFRLDHPAPVIAVLGGLHVALLVGSVIYYFTKERDVHNRAENPDAALKAW